MTTEAEFVTFLNSQAPAPADPGAQLITSDSLDARLALERSAVAQLTIDVNALETELDQKMNVADFDVRVNPFISNWLTTYINASPTSWVNLRTLLQYYPLTYSTWTSPVDEFVARSTEHNGRTWKRIIDTTNNPNSFPSLHSLVTSHFVGRDATDTRPYAIQRIANASTYGTMGINWSNRGTVFVVYSWSATPVSDRIVWNSIGNTGTNINNTGAQCRLTRGSFTINLEAGGTASFPGPPVVDTDVGVPYVLGFSWDFTVNPPRFCWVNHRYAIEHIGPNEPTELLQITDTGLIPTPATSWNIPYTAFHANSSRPATLAMWGTIQAPGTTVDMHWVGRWTTHMDMEQARTVHMRLLQRYCVPPFPALNYQLQDDVPDPVTQPPP